MVNTVSPENGSTSTAQKRVAIFIGNGVEDSEFKIPYTALKQAGANVRVVGSRMNDEYKGKQGKVSVRPDATFTEVRSEDFDAIIIPGGQAPDHIRTNDNAVRLVMDGMAQGILIAAVCHGPQVLIEADQLRGKRATGFRSIRKDMENAGATYVDESVVVDGNLITSRRPSDLALFTEAILGNLGLLTQVTRPDAETNTTFDWWQRAAAWGGSSRQDILNALNAGILGERYTLDALKQYGDRAADPELGVVLQEIVGVKNTNLMLLEARLKALGEEVTWQTVGSDAYATLQSWLQSSDDLSIMRRTLGDIQTGIVDAMHFSSQLTDPTTADLFHQVELNLLTCEERLSTLYRARMGEKVESPKPTTLAATA
ncbi:MAG: type 1 glutamine amidotransferase domain-containing protein [Synechococcales bacterium]|nr:type 1 glutamine amidotransferase domain-containing protein [Synechococcales bacterium]